MYPPPEPQLVADRMAERRSAAEAHRARRPLRQAAARRRAERRAAAMEAVGVGLVKAGLRVVSAGRRQRGEALPSPPMRPSL